MSELQSQPNEEVADYRLLRKATVDCVSKKNNPNQRKKDPPKPATVEGPPSGVAAGSDTQVAASKRARGVSKKKISTADEPSKVQEGQPTQEAISVVEAMGSTDPRPAAEPEAPAPEPEAPTAKPEAPAPEPEAPGEEVAVEAHAPSPDEAFVARITEMESALALAQERTAELQAALEKQSTEHQTELDQTRHEHQTQLEQTRHEHQAELEQTRREHQAENEQQREKSQRLELESTSALEKLAEVRGTLAETQTQLADTLEVVRGNQDELGELNAEVDAAQLRFDATQAELTSIQQQLALTETRLTDTRGELDMTRAELAQAVESGATWERQAQLVDGRLEESEAAHSATQARLAEIEVELEEANLLQEDLEETIVDRRREIRELRAGRAESQKMRTEAEDLMTVLRHHEAALEQRLANSAQLSRQREDELTRALEIAEGQLRLQASQGAQELAVSQEQVVALQDRLSKIEMDKVRVELRGRILEKDLKDALDQVTSLQSQTAISQSTTHTTDDVEVRLRAQVADLQKALADAEAKSATMGARTDGDQWKKKFEEVLETLQSQRRQNEELGNLLKLNQARANEAEERCRELDIRLRNSLRARAREGY